MRIEAFFLCYNEAPLLPFVLEHYSEFCDKITIYDNCSIDDSVKIIKSYPNTKVISYDGHGLDDLLHQKIKNECWKGTKCDWVVVADIDELIYCKDIKKRLAELDAEWFTIVNSPGYNMVSKTFPLLGIKITEQITRGAYHKMSSKPILFNPNKITELNSCPGGHGCSPTGEVKFYNSLTGDIRILHYRMLSLAYYLDHQAKGLVRVNKENLAKGLGSHLAAPVEAHEWAFYDTLKSAEEIVNV